MTRVKPFHLQTPLTVTYVPCYKPTFSSFKKKKTQNPNIFTFMVSEFRKYRTELKKALKWPPPPQRKKREEKLVMSWSLCDCLTADVTQLYTLTHLLSLAAKPLFSSQESAPENLLHTGLWNTAPPTHPDPTLDAPGKKKKNPFFPLPPPAPSKPQTQAEGRA